MSTLHKLLKVGVIGAGAWGTALATVLIDSGHDVLIWAFEPEVAKDINERHENRVYLPGITLSPTLRATSDLGETATDRDMILSVCPAQHVRAVTSEWFPHARPDAMVINASKGIEIGTGKLISQIYDEVLPDGLRQRTAYLSGPSFAREVALKMPTVVVVAAEDESLAEQVQHAFATPNFRTYRTTDVVGVEVAGALKNVVALATGMCDGMELGYNARAAVITRGLTEITRMAVKLGADPITLMGLAGMGDLVLTCTADLSRNRTVGKALGSGRPLEEVLGGMKQVVEGVATAKSAYHLSQRLGADTPILDEVYGVLYQGASIEGAGHRLMTRALKREGV